MTEDIDKYKRERTPLRRLATQSINGVNKIIKEKERHDYVAALRGHQSILNNKLESLQNLDAKIAALTEDDGDLEKESDEANKYQMDIYMCISLIDEALKETSSRAPSEAEVGSSSRSSVKLPKVNIDPFDGEVTNFPAFIDSFSRIIDENSSLADIEKFYYLRGLLKGKAKMTLEGLTLSEDNYQEALNLLKARFGDKKLLQANFVDSLLKLKGVSDAKDTKGLRNLYDNIEKCIRNLKVLGVTSESFGPMLIPCILQKLPEEIRLEVAKDVTGENWDFDEVLQLFNNQLTAREKCYFVTKADHVKGAAVKPFTASSLTVQNARQNVLCIFCNRPNHKAWNCDVVTDVRARRKLVVDQKRCFNCLRKNHLSRKCTSRYSCYKCKEKHNMSLCDKNEVMRSDSGLTGTTGVSLDQQPPSNQTLTAMANKVGEDTVLLKTAIVTALSMSGEFHTTDRMLLDDASTKTYITRKLRDRLNLQTISSRRRWPLSGIRSFRGI